MLPITPPSDTHEVTDVDVAAEEGHVEVASRQPLNAFVVVFGIMVILAIIAIAVSMSAGGGTEAPIPQNTDPMSAPFWGAVS